MVKYTHLKSYKIHLNHLVNDFLTKFGAPLSFQEIETTIIVVTQTTSHTDILLENTH